MKPNRWEIENFCYSDECDAIIDLAEIIVGFEQATLNTQTGVATKIEYRNNKRATFDQPELAKELWERLKNDSRLLKEGWKAIGLNERFRVYKYSDPKEFFALHYDGRFLRTIAFEESWVTILVYLNDNFEGGETSFHDGDVIPKKGKAALMTQGNVLHEALSVKSGTKYVLRSDVMYRKV